MKLSFLLCDSAQASEGKLYILGAGWNFTGPQVTPMALALLVEVPWNEANLQHQVVIELHDEDGQPARIGPEAQPLRIETQLEVGRPPGHPHGTPLNVPLAINLGPLPLTPGGRYVWVVSIDGETDDHWRASFNVRPGAPA
ncbi:MAG: hypothetical protein AABZ33_07965 [Chloroflexota bacterium]